ncbi:competence type IV pilus minor pilin ComGG [Cytobacillus sp. FJAT-54145]|uniref:Competence type IV pilus minor pilin ComGG n=1 Tax=Cytobacillus spartinae TaxID=3299023 RepID=A0ABW6KE28_9BACI
MNERGFLYPFTLCVLLIFSTFLLVQSNLYLDEKRLLNEIEQMEKSRYYFLSSIKKMEFILAEESFENAGHLLFRDGGVHYIIEEETDRFKITFNLTVGSNDNLMGIGYYDKVSKKMIKWIEKN